MTGRARNVCTRVVRAQIAGARIIAGAALVALANTAAAQGARAPLHTLRDIGAALRICWAPPPNAQARPGMQITVQLAFKRNGELLGKPRITFETAGASDDQRLAYRLAVAAMIKRCTPLPFVDALGNAVAGRPFTMRFIDDRKLKQAENTQWLTPKTR